MPSLARWARLLLAWCALCAATLGAAAAPPALELRPGSDAVDAWPAIRVLADPTGAMTLDDALRRGVDFAPPDVPYANFGVHRAPLWMRVPVVRSGGGAHWVLELDYPSLNRIDAWVLRPGGEVRHVVMGNALHALQRPMRTRAHAMTLDLPDREPVEIVLRVQTASSMVAPVRFHTEPGFLQHESRRQLLQGLMFGLTLALLVYTVAHGLSMRDPLFAQYATLIAGMSVFFLAYTGIGHQHLWDEQSGVLAKMAPLGALLALVGGALFTSNVLRMRENHPWLWLAMQVLAAVAALTFLLSAAGVLDYRSTQLAASAMGPMPVIVALRAALVQAHRGDRSARLMVIGWGAYTAGAVSMALLLRGFLPGDFWGQHLFQLSSFVEMLAWMRVLGLRIDAVRREAEAAAVEARTLQALAHTDALTGLPNRRGLHDALARALPASRPDAPLAVFLLDLDGFKPINDRLGHDAGDELLVQVGRRLKALLRHGDVVARLGGDEFVVVCPDLAGEPDAEHLGGKMLQAFREPFPVAGQACRVGLTVGYAMAPHDGLDAAGLLKRADAAMYAGKQAGRDCLRRGAASAGLAGA